MVINGDLSHENLTREATHSLAYDKTKPLDEQRRAARAKLEELMGISKIAKNACPQNMIIEYEEEKDGYTLIRFCFESERGFFVPAYLLIPTTGKEKYPVAITLQGHKKGGMYNSIGITKNADDEEYQPRGAFALQAVKEGFAALCVELRGMSGELQPVKEERLWGGNCPHPALTAIMLGRTILGERCWDVSRAIDLLPNFPQLDCNDITITGNSGGGTMSYYAACLDERITLSAPSCAFCTFEHSILNVHHCACNYIPNIFEYFEMQDIAVLLAPRKLVVIAGKDDGIFLLEGVKKGYETIEQIYAQAGVEERCKLVVTPKGHYWCEELVWSAIRAMREVK